MNRKPQLLILISLTFISYINVYNNQFLSDDLAGIVYNLQIKDLALSLKSLSIVNIINTITYLLFGPNEIAFHFINVLFHCLNVLIIYKLFNSLQEKTLSFPIALLFAVHPLHTEAVTWVSGRPYTIYAFFSLLSILCFVIYSNKFLKKYLFVSVVSFLTAVFTSEKAIVVPVIIFFYLLIYKNIKKYLFSLSMIFLSAVPYALTLSTRLQERISALNPNFQAAFTYNPLTQIPTAIATYIELTLLPINLTLYHSFLFTPTEIIFKYAITLLFLVFTIIAFKKSKILFFACMLYLIPLTPTMLPINIGWIVAERYAYFSSLGLIIIVVYFIYKFPRPKQTVILLSLIFMGMTLVRNSEWRDQDSLWPATLAKSYNVPVAHNNMGDYYFRRKDLAAAKIEFNKAIELSKGFYPDAIHNLANVFWTEKDFKTAEELYKKALSQNPKSIQSYLQLASISLNQNDLKKAESWITKLNEINPNYSPAYNTLGIIYIKKNDINKARSYFQKAVDLDPSNSQAINNLMLTQHDKTPNK